MASGRFIQNIEDFLNVQESLINFQKSLVSFGEYQKISESLGVLGRVFRSESVGEFRIDYSSFGQF